MQQFQEVIAMEQSHPSLTGMQCEQVLAAMQRNQQLLAMQNKQAVARQNEQPASGSSTRSC
jgi:hypothetical protein